MEEILISLMPAIIIIAVWVFIILKFRKYNKTNNIYYKHDEMINLLKEIKDELKNLKENNSDKKL